MELEKIVVGIPSIIIWFILNLLGVICVFKTMGDWSDLGDNIGSYYLGSGITCLWMASILGIMLAGWLGDS